MSTADVFYPGFEHAGLETPVDRILTWACCTAVMVVAGVSDLVSIAAPRRAAEPVFDA